MRYTLTVADAAKTRDIEEQGEHPAREQDIGSKKQVFVRYKARMKHELYSQKEVGKC